MIKIRIRILRHIDARARGEAEDGLTALDSAVAYGIARWARTLYGALSRGDTAEANRCRLGLDTLLREGHAAYGTRASAQELLSQRHLTYHKRPAEPGPSDGATDYWVSSETLANAYSYLTQRLPGRAQEPEWMLAVTGLKLGSARTLENLIEVKMESQSAARASFDMREFTKVAMSLMEHGQALHGVFHSHRFRGQPQPSSTDLRLQAILEEGGYPAVQAVFSEDGYVHFFAQKKPFTIEVHGKGVERVGERTFHILQLGALPHPATAAPDARRSASV